jgi:DNA-binding NarL/FixJ family response regulator
VLIAIVDDHALIRDGLRHVVQSMDEGGVEVAEFENADTLWSWLEQGAAPNLVLLDLYLPGDHGIHHLGRLCQRWPELRVLVCSASEDTLDMRSAIDHGAAGFASKSLPREQLLDVIRLVLDGGVYLPSVAVPAQTPAGHALTQRQIEVLRCVAQGLSNKLIARALDMSGNTVKSHIATILHVLDAANRTEAVTRAQQLGYLETVHVPHPQPQLKN